MSSRPSFQTYPGDWFKDENLAACSPATRGIWWDAILRMHENDRSGKLSGTIEQLARVCRCTEAEMESAVQELQTTKTADIRYSNGKVFLYNRRMLRESRERKANAERQKRYRSRQSNATGNAKITRSSSSSSSTSTSTSLPRDELTTKGNGKDEAAGLRRSMYLKLKRDHPEKHEEAMESQVLETTSISKLKLEYRKLASEDFFSTG